jgi:hypothetical protein
MSRGLRSTRIAAPLQTIDRDQAPAAGFFLTTEYAYLGEKMPSVANNPPNVVRLAGGVGAAYVGSGMLTFVRQPGRTYRQLTVPSNLTGQRQ